MHRYEHTLLWLTVGLTWKELEAVCRQQPGERLNPNSFQARQKQIKKGQQNIFAAAVK